MGIGDWWKRLWGGDAPKTEAIADEGPVMEPGASAVEMPSTVLSPTLTAREFHHALGTRDGVLQVRTFVTVGIKARGAREISMTLPRSWSAGTVQLALNILRQLDDLAAQGSPAVLGGYSAFSSSDLGEGRSLGLIYARGVPLNGVPVGRSTLCAVLVHAEECALAQRGYSTRVLARLANDARHFPHPPWWALRDRPVLSRREVSESVLEKGIPQMHVGDVRVTEVAGEIHLSLPGDAARVIDEYLQKRPDLATLAMFAKLAPDADGQMLWFAGEQTPRANAPHGQKPTRMGYSFALFVMHGEQDLMRMSEDGVSYVLCAASFAKLREALTTGRELSLPISGGAPLRVSFRAVSDEGDIQVQTVNGVTWTEITVPGKPGPSSSRVSDVRIVLLLPEKELSERVTSSDLAQTAASIQAEIERAAASHPVPAACAITVRYTLSPGTPPRILLGAKNNNRPALFAPLHTAIKALPLPPATGDIAFEVHATIRPHPPSN